MRNKRTGIGFGPALFGWITDLGDIGETPRKISGALGVSVELVRQWRRNPPMSAETCAAYLRMLHNEFGYPQAMVGVDPDSGRGYINRVFETPKETADA